VHESTRQLRHAPVEIPASKLPAPIVSYDVGRRRWRLEAPYAYRDGERLLTVPRDFEFDLASVPRAFWWVIAPFELSIAAPLLHDFLYHFRGRTPPGAVVPPGAYDRAGADRLFAAVMAEEGVAGWRRALAYLATRALGGPAWAAGRPV
jgi:hypothetical protein